MSRYVSYSVPRGDSLGLVRSGITQSILVHKVCADPHGWANSSRNIFLLVQGYIISGQHFMFDVELRSQNLGSSVRTSFQVQVHSSVQTSQLFSHNSQQFFELFS